MGRHALSCAMPGIAREEGHVSRGCLGKLWCCAQVAQILGERHVIWTENGIAPTGLHSARGGETLRIMPCGSRGCVVGCKAHACNAGEPAAILCAVVTSRQ